MNVRNVHVLHKNAVSADRLKGSQNLTIQRTLTGAKDSRNESVAEFVDELNMLVGSADGDGVDAECIGAAKKLAAQFDERRKKIAEVKEKKSAAALSLSNDIYCDYDCGYRPPEYNYNSPYPYEFDYDKYGPTWAGGGGGYTDSFTNSFFNNYYGSYSSPDVLYAGSFGSIAGAAKNVYGRVDTADTLAGGCKDGTGIGGCIGGAAKAWMSGTLQGAAVNGGLMIMGASKFIPMVGTALTVFEPQPTGGSSMTDFCKTSFGANQDYCAYYRYEYR
jgi:hypothetical protein